LSPAPFGSVSSLNIGRMPKAFHNHTGVRYHAAHEDVERGVEGWSWLPAGLAAFGYRARLWFERQRQESRRSGFRERVVGEQ
jgi:hypothetical protein